MTKTKVSAGKAPAREPEMPKLKMKWPCIKKPEAKKKVIVRLPLPTEEEAERARHAKRAPRDERERQLFKAEEALADALARAVGTQKRQKIVEKLTALLEGCKLAEDYEGYKN